MPVTATRVRTDGATLERIKMSFRKFPNLDRSAT